jgi:hypothetical protein
VIANPIERGANYKAGSFVASVNYIRGLSGERPVAEFTRGIFRPQFAAAEMEAVAATSSRCRDPVVHWIVSWAAGEHPSHAEIREIVETLLADLDMAESQYLIVVHGDTDNLHCHFVANRVVAGKAAPMTQSIVRATQSVARQARVRGWDVVKSPHNFLESQTQALERGLTKAEFQEYWKSSADTLSQWARREPGQPHFSARQLAQIDKGQVPFEAEFGAEIHAALDAASSWAAFEAGCDAIGVACVVEVKTNSKTGQILPGVKFRSRDGASGESGTRLGLPYRDLAKKFGQHPLIGPTPQADPVLPISVESERSPTPGDTVVRDASFVASVLESVRFPLTVVSPPAEPGRTSRFTAAPSQLASKTPPAVRRLQDFVAAAVDRRIRDRLRRQPAVSKSPVGTLQSLQPTKGGRDANGGRLAEPQRRLTPAQGRDRARIRDATALGLDLLSLTFESVTGRPSPPFATLFAKAASTIPAAIEATQRIAAAAFERRLRDRRVARATASESGPARATNKNSTIHGADGRAGAHGSANASLRDQWRAARTAHQENIRAALNWRRNQAWEKEHIRRQEERAAICRHRPWVEMGISVFLPRSVRTSVRRQYRAALRRKAAALGLQQKARWDAAIIEIRRAAGVRPAPTFPQFLARRVLESDPAAAKLLRKINPKEVERIIRKRARRADPEFDRRLKRAINHVAARFDQTYGERIDRALSRGFTAENAPFLPEPNSRDGSRRNSRWYDLWLKERARTLSQRKEAARLAAEAEVEAFAEKARQLTDRVRRVLGELRGQRGRGDPIAAAPEKVRDKFDRIRRAIQQRYERDYTPRLISDVAKYARWHMQSPPMTALIAALPQDRVGVARKWLSAWALWKEPEFRRLASEQQRQQEQRRAAAAKLARGRPEPAEMPRSTPISRDAWLALGSRDQTYAALAFASSIENSTADIAACLSLMSPPARGVGERAVEVGATRRRGEGAVGDPEIALLQSATKLQPSSDEVVIFERAGAVNIVAAMIETLRERERAP